MKGSDCVIKKRNFSIMVSILSVVILVLVGLVIKEKRDANQYSDTVKNRYLKDFEQLNESLANISIALEKTVYASSAKTMSTLATEIICEAELAKAALAELPIDKEEILGIYRFLSQVEDYPLSVSRNISDNEEISENQREELSVLSDAAKAVSTVLNNAELKYDSKNKWADDLEAELNFAVSEENLGEAAQILDEVAEAYYTSIYDCSYSGRMLSRCPLMTSSAREYTKAMALEIAEKAVESDEGLSFDGIQSGKIECYRFSKDDTVVDISKMGGYAVYMQKERSIGEKQITYEQAISRAKNFLEDLGFKNLTDTFYYTDGGVCVINFVYLDGQTLCYTDLIKIGVAMDNGEIMLLDTSCYLTNHTARAFIVPEFTAEQAAEKISEDLKISKTAVALIPTDTGAEVRCYEFLCECKNGRKMLIYINMRSLKQEGICLLIESDNGILLK